MIDWSERPRYESDNSVSAARFPFLLIVPFVAAIVVAWILKTAFFGGWYILALVPGVAGFILGGVVYGMVGLSHCRNAWLGALVGLLAGLVGFLGYYHLCMLDEPLGPDEVWRVDLLPAYIQARLES